MRGAALRIVPLIVVHFLLGCHSSSHLRGDADGEEDSWGVDATSDEYPGDVVDEDTIWWECTDDTDCMDGDPCTLDSCDSGTHECSHTVIHGPALMGPNIQVTSTPQWSGWPSLSWTGSQIGMFWNDGRIGGCLDPFGPTECNYEAYFVALGPEGEVVSPETRVSHTEEHTYPASSVWTGSEFVIAWSDSVAAIKQIYLSRITVDGMVVGDPVQPAGGDSAMSPTVEWTGSEFAVLWTQSEEGMPGALYFSHFDAELAEINTVVLDPDTGTYTYGGKLVWTGSEIGASWRRIDGPDLWRMNPAGERIGTGTTIFEGRIAVRQLLWTGSEFGLFWTSYGDYSDIDDPCAALYPDCTNIHFLRVGGEGDIIGEEVRATETASEKQLQGVAWTGSEYGISWNVDTGWGYESYLTRITPVGSVIGDDVPLPRPSAIVWTGSEYFLGFNDNPDGYHNVFVNRVGFCE